MMDPQTIQGLILASAYAILMLAFYKREQWWSAILLCSFISLIFIGLFIKQSLE